MRRYPFAAMLNLRDLGGYPKKGGGMTPFGRFLRGDAPVALASGEIEALQSMGINCVIDLRGEREAAAHPNALSGRDGFELHNVSLVAEDYDYVPVMENSVADMYLHIAKNTQAMERVFRAIAGTDGGVFYHCAVGKDRTGVVSALLLRLAGVSDADIIADYQVSYTYLRPMIERNRALYENVPMSLWHSNVEYMDGFLKKFDKEYGSMLLYLQKIGLSDGEIAAIERKLSIS